jgi:hypothetical protein
MRSRGRIVSIAAPLFVIAAAVAAFLFVRGAVTYVFEGPASQFYAGGEFKVPAGAHMRRDEGVSVLYYDNIERDAANLPIYLEGGDIVMPCDTVYYDPRGGVSAKMDHFARISHDGNGGVTATRGGRVRALSRGFLYDGKDIFVFLEPVTVRFNGYRIELSAMSYAEAVYDGSVMLYDAESGEFTIEAPLGAAECEFVAGDCVISLLSDYFTKADGERLLLFTKPELLDSYFR